MRRFSLGLVLAVGVLSSQMAKAQDAKVEVMGVAVGKKLTEAQKSVFLFTNEGTRLQIALALPGRVFIGAERAACKLTEFSDDKGTELFGSLGHAPETDDWLGAFGPKFSEDGKICGLQVEAPDLPAKDATKLKFSGDLALRCGSAPKTVEQKKIAVKKGSKITVGPVALDISAVRPDGNGWSLDIHAKHSLERMIKYAFFDAAGKPIGGKRDGMESSEMLGNYSVTETYKLSRKVPDFTIKISYFDKVENVTIPVRVEAGLGFGP